MQKNTAVLSLDLRANQVGPNGGRAVAQMLQFNNSLTALSLQKNALPDDSCVSLAKALRTNPSLTALDLRFNDVGDSGAMVPPPLPPRISPLAPPTQP